MKTLIHFSRSGDSYFRSHPHHPLFSLVVTFVLAVLAVLIFAATFSESLLRNSGRFTQVCEMLPYEGAEAYKKEGPKFMQRLVAKRKARVKDA